MPRLLRIPATPAPGPALTMGEPSIGTTLQKACQKHCNLQENDFLRKFSDAARCRRAIYRECTVWSCKLQSSMSNRVYRSRMIGWADRDDGGSRRAGDPAGPKSATCRLALAHARHRHADRHAARPMRFRPNQYPIALRFRAGSEGAAVPERPGWMDRVSHDAHGR